MKEDAAAKNKALFEEYGRQPKGTRNVWVTQKLRELSAAGYFDDNPFLKSFKYASPDSVAKADKQLIVQTALKTGDWSQYRAKFGLSEKQKAREQALKSGDWSGYVAKYGKTEKAQARDKAVASGDWSAYRAKYGTTVKTTPHQSDGKYFKSAESMEKYAEGQFWHKYATASKDERKKLLADNPKYNTRAGWTMQDWLTEKRRKSAEDKKKLVPFGNIAMYMSENRAETEIKARRFQATKGRRVKKIQFHR
jgi:hypothetical protein